MTKWSSRIRFDSSVTRIQSHRTSAAKLSICREEKGKRLFFTNIYEYED